MTQAGQNDTPPTRGLGPVHAFAHLLEAFCHSHREHPGTTIVRVQFGTWCADMRLAELYNVLGRLRATGGVDR